MASCRVTTGRITVESEEGRGTTFRLLFPSISGTVAEAPAARGGSRRRWCSLRCLVVDDEEEVGEVVADILTTAGHTAVVARSGQEAVSRLGAERFDLVFTDLAMPGMTGWQVARAVKDRAPGVPVVLVSGFGVEVAPEELAGAAAWTWSSPSRSRYQDVLARRCHRPRGEPERMRP